MKKLSTYKGKMMMKKMNILSTTALALILSMNISYASLETDVDVGIDDQTFAKALVESRTPTKWRDINGDGDRDLHDVKAFFSKHFKHLDFNGDGSVNFYDIVAGAKNLWKETKGIFDGDGDGTVEFDEILVGTRTALGKVEDLSDRILKLSSNIKDDDYFNIIPGSVKDPLVNLLTIVDKAASEAKQGLNVGGKYVDTIDEALNVLKKRANDFTQGDLSVDDLTKAKKDVFAYLEMIKGWYNTGDNTDLISKIEKKLAKLKV